MNSRLLAYVLLVSATIGCGSSEAVDAPDAVDVIDVEDATDTASPVTDAGPDVDTEADTGADADTDTAVDVDTAPDTNVDVVDAESDTNVDVEDAETDAAVDADADAGVVEIDEELSRELSESIGGSDGQAIPARMFLFEDLVAFFVGEDSPTCAEIRAGETAGDPATILGLSVPAPLVDGTYAVQSGLGADLVSPLPSQWLTANDGVLSVSSVSSSIEGIFSLRFRVDDSVTVELNGRFEAEDCDL